MSRETDLAWAAGFIDGEGTFGIQRQEGHKDLPYLQVGQVDRRPLDKLQAIIGCGKVYGPYQPKKNHSPYHYYRLMGSERVCVAGDSLSPYLSEAKLEQFNKLTLR